LLDQCLRCVWHYELLFEPGMQGGVGLNELLGRTTGVKPSDPRPSGATLASGVSDYEPGRRVRFRFDPRLELTGHHEFEVESRHSRTILRHRLEATPRPHAHRLAADLSCA
jgi:hypothetical protein